MLATLRDRLTVALLVLVGGSQVIESDYLVAGALTLIAALDCGWRARARKHSVTAVARASELPAGTRPASDPALLEALRRAGVPAERVSRMIESGECADCVRLPIADRRDSKRE